MSVSPLPPPTSLLLFSEQEVVSLIFAHRLLLSLRLTGVETLKLVSQNFKRRFHFLFLVLPWTNLLQGETGWTRLKI